MPKYKKDDSHVFISLESLLRIKDIVIEAFESNTNDLLVIDCKTTEGNIKELYNQLSSVIKSNNNKKIILITKEGDTLANEFETEFCEKGDSPNDKYKKIKDKNSNFNDLNAESQEKLLTEGKIVFKEKK